MSNKKEVKWTPMQELAINERNKTLLVSAAAGSGKTATLTQRIITRITQDDADISRMLIVTFTRASAADLRLKIYKAISEALAKNPQNRHLSNQLTKLNNAKICTIDSFYYDIIKSNFTEAGVSPSFRIIDEGEYKLIAKSVMNDAIDDLYENDPNFPRFVECFTSIRSSKNLADTFLSIYSALSTVPAGIDYINECAAPLYAQANLDFYQTDCGKLLKEITEEFFTHYKNLLEYALDIISDDDFVKDKYGSQISEDLGLCQTILDELHLENCVYSTIKEHLESFSHTKMGTVSAANKTDESVLAKAIRDEFKDKKEDLYEKYYMSTQETVPSVMKETADHTATLYNLLKNFQSRLDIQKQKLNFLTFSDVSRKTYNILIKNKKPTELAKKIALEYDDIYIDEYQDVDYLQDDIFSAIATPTNRFMVGDIKQSIYKFRGAEPTLFSKYRKAFPNIEEKKESNAATIFMSNNFRCDKNVINFTNLVCSNIFKTAGGCVKYVDKDNLLFSKDNEDTIDDKHISVNIIHVPKKSSNSKSNDEDDEDDYIALEWESEFIATQIESLIGKERNDDGSLIKAGDIAVLFRSKSINPHLSAALYRRNIKVAEADSTKYFENDDVLMMLCILNSIDNPERDIYLAGTLRSPLFNFSADELLLLRSQYSEPYSLFGGLCAYIKDNEDELSKKCQVFIQKLSYWQEIASTLSIDRFLLMLFNDDMIISSGIISNQNDDGEGGNILLLYEYARSFNQNGFSSLYEFIEYINSLIEEDQNLPEITKSSSSDRVSLMSIHKSKGLEFPVCFLSYSGKAFSLEESKQSLILNYPLGLAMKLADQSGFALLNTPMRQVLLAKALRSNVEEEIRTLYVALTRARERLHVVGTTQSNRETLETKAKINSICKDSYSTLCASRNYIDWILLALQHDCPQYVDVNFLSPEDITLSLDDISEEENVEITEIDTELYKKLSESFQFNYEYQELSKVPSKLSVSRLYPDVLDDNDTSLTLFSDDKSAKIPTFFSKETPIPSASERGTATHLFFQFCNFDYAAVHGIDEELERLCELKYLPENAPDLIYKDELDKFLQSDLIKQIFAAKQIIREQRFNISLPVNNFTKNADLIEKMNGEPLAVQGVIDLILVDKDGNIKLFDYKTDRMSDKELANPKLAKWKLNNAHSTQLSYYAKAIEQMFGKKCESVQIYSTHSGLLYDIDLTTISEDII